VKAGGHDRTKESRSGMAHGTGPLPLCRPQKRQIGTGKMEKKVNTALKLSECTRKTNQTKLNATAARHTVGGARADARKRRETWLRMETTALNCISMILPHQEPQIHAPSVRERNRFISLLSRERSNLNSQSQKKKREPNTLKLRCSACKKVETPW